MNAIIIRFAPINWIVSALTKQPVRMGCGFGFGRDDSKTLEDFTRFRANMPGGIIEILSLEAAQAHEREIHDILERDYHEYLK